MVNAATKRAYELPDSYFAFLGPLVDIRSTDQTVDTATWNSITDGRGSRSVVICHHSLTQWIEGTASTIKKSSEWWQEFHFTRIDAHKPLALLCLVMISSGKNLSKFLQNIYVPFRCTSPFLNYAGEFWSFHLRAAGGWTSTEHRREARYRDGPTKNLVLVDFATTTLEKGIDTAAGVCLALSTAVESIDVQKIGSLPKVTALRRLETTILPATRAIARLQSAMTDVYTTLLEIQAELGLSSADYNPGVLFDMTTTTLDSNLDSETVLRVSATLRTSPSGSATSHLLSRERRRRKEHIKIICEASRALRQLSILLAVDPVRAWIYSLIGDSGVSPLTALSHTSDAIDTYLAASLLPPELFSQYDFRDQFNAQHSHPQYGLITAARHELSAQNDGSLDATFYKEHVRKHYSISAWERNTTRVIIAALEAFPEDPQGMDTAIKIWISSNKLWPKPSSDNNFEPAFEVINRLRSQNIYRSATRLKELLSTLIRGGAVFCFKYIIHLVPPLEHVFLSALMSGRMVRGGLAPTLKLLTGNWKDFVFVFLLYLFRCRYFPWLFGTAQTLHWNSIFGPIYDIRGIIADPKGYVPPFAPTSWPWLRFIYYMVQEAVIWSLSVFDVISAQSVSEGGVIFDISPESLPRRTSFRFNWNNGDTRGQLEKLRKATVSHAFAFFVTLRRLLFVERLLGTAVGWVFDLLNAAAGMAHSSPWKGKSMLFYGVQMVSFAYGRSVGVIGGLKLSLRIYLWSALFSWYHPSSLFGLTYRYAYLPAKNISTRACARYIDNILAKVSSFSKLIDALEATIIQAVQGLHVRTLLFTLAGAICVIGLLFWYIMSDPLSLGSAARSCQEAEDLARRTTSIQDPVTFLKWRSDKPEKEHAIAFTDRSLDDYDAEE